MPKKVSKTYVHVNQHIIRSNKKHNKTEPVITVKKGSKNTYCHEVHIDGPSKVVYGGNDKPLLSCGARVERETNAEVVAIRNEDMCTYRISEYQKNANSKQLVIATDTPKKP